MKGWRVLVRRTHSNLITIACSLAAEITNSLLTFREQFLVTFSPDFTRLVRWPKSALRAKRKQRSHSTVKLLEGASDELRCCRCGLHVCSPARSKVIRSTFDKFVSGKKWTSVVAVTSNHNTQSRLYLNKPN